MSVLFVLKNVWLNLIDLKNCGRELCPGTVLNTYVARSKEIWNWSVFKF